MFTQRLQQGYMSKLIDIGILVLHSFLYLIGGILNGDCEKVRSIYTCKL